MVGQWLGAQVIGMDYEEEALHFASLNARHNGVTSPLWTVMDWRQPAVRPRSIFRLWGGDIMYEKRFVAPVMHFLSHVLADNGAAWVAEPGAACTRPFCRPCTAAVWKGGACSPSVWNPCMPSPCPSRWPYGRYAAASGPRRPGSWALEPSRPGSLREGLVPARHAATCAGRGLLYPLPQRPGMTGAHLCRHPACPPLFRHVFS